MFLTSGQVRALCNPDEARGLRDAVGPWTRPDLPLVLKSRSDLICGPLEGGCVDLRVRAVSRQWRSVDAFMPYFPTILRRKTRDLPKQKPIAPKQGQWFLRAGWYLIQTFETLNVPNRISALIRPKSTTFRGGIQITCGIAHGGYFGTITALMNVLNPDGLILDVGARLLQVRFDVAALTGLPSAESYATERFIQNWSDLVDPPCTGTQEFKDSYRAIDHYNGHWNGQRAVTDGEEPV